ncbi:uncharacterized protein LOC142826075 isoform X5 [Pelodiscus sinensis]|uniref:uncharacterized protein LOC142826075 isoform X5 n=1 Tax=Pelodiscus sinensis TaxID=13735 RepID=UPI003F6DA4C7
MAPLALLLVLWLCPGPQGLDPLDPGLLAQGRARLQEAQLLAQHPQLGACWAGALGRLDVGCQELDEEQQSRIALAFAHCHLQRSGRPFPPCEAGSSVRACTQHMDPVAFGVYTEFFTHAHSLCYLLRGEAWRRRAQRTAHRLILLALVAVNVYLERTLSGLVLENAEASSDPTEALARWVGLCRRLCAGAGLAVLAYCTLTYRDVAQQSRELLRGLQETRAQMQDILQETERLLAQRGQKPSQDSMEFVDSGFPEPLSQPERGAPWGPGAEGRTSSPKPRSGSPARQRARLQRRPSRRDSEPHDNPPPWDRLCRYDLRRRPSLQLPPR